MRQTVILPSLASRGLPWMDHNSKAEQPLQRSLCETGGSTDAKVFWLVFLGPVFGLLLLAMPAFAQTMPENASAKSYGEGWDCDIGYRPDGDNCAAVAAPENAYETNRSYGTGWACLHGYHQVNETACVAVVVPEGGFLDPSGERWHCLRGFHRVDDSCQKVVVPENAYLVEASFGSAWDCERGFEKTGQSCTAVVVPTNGYLNGSRYGQLWSCERGFFEQDAVCKPVVVPEFGYLDDAAYGEGWKCHRGYEASGAACKEIDIPENAHLDRSGNRWECNWNFQKSKGLCVLNH